MHIQFGGETHAVPAGAVIGLIGDSGSGVSDILQAAGGRFIGPGHELDLSPASLICIGYVLDLRDAFTRLRIETDFERLRRAGSTVLLASHDTDLLQRAADEVWWVDCGRVVAKGVAAETINAYRRQVAEKLRRSTAPSALDPALRRGDGRAELIELLTLDAAGLPTGAWASGEEAVIRVRVRFSAAVEDPVVGIMIRTRIGMEVYGTNTELEKVTLGPCAAGDVRTVEFRFICNLCPQYYTLTAASHDPDGTWHDWLEDAVAFTVTDLRYTAGVANLRAAVTCFRE